MLTVATLLWDANDKSHSFSRCYNEEWVERLYRGFKRNLTVPFQFMCWTDRHRGFSDDIHQAFLSAERPSYASCIEPFVMDGPMILTGLDTVVLRTIDHLAAYCMDESNLIALPRDPYAWHQACNGVCLVPPGKTDIFRKWNGENDMEWLRRFPHRFIDDLFPDSVVSYKGHVLGQTGQVMRGKPDPRGLTNVDIVYMHGVPKQHQLTNERWIQENWV